MMAFILQYSPAWGRAYETDNLFQLEEVGRPLGRIHQIGRKRVMSIDRQFLLQNI